MGHDDQGHAFLLVQLDEQLTERSRGGVVESAGRFIGEQELRTIDECADDSSALTFAATELARAMV